MKKPLNISFEVGKTLYEIKPTTEGEYHYHLNRNGRFCASLDGTISTAFNPPKIRFECSCLDFEFSFCSIAIQDAINLLEAHHLSEP